MDLLTVRGLTKRYQGFTLQDVSFTVPGGSIVGLIGENGAGKSTTLGAILGLIRPDAGEVSFGDTPIGDAPIGDAPIGDAPARMEAMGAVLDGIGFHGALTARQVGRICRAAYRSWDDELYASCLARFALEKEMDKPIRSLSKGMKMKLAIAAALAHHPKLLILDEATSGLDPVMRDDMLDVFLSFVQDEEHAILMSSHISADLEKAADYIVCIHEGQVLFCREKDELRYRWGILRCGEALFRAMVPGEMLAYRREDYQYSVLVPDREKALRLHPDAVMDAATIDEILLLYVKGVRTA